MFGLDFMLDDEFKVFLIEVNTNPDLVVKESPILARLIPTVLDNTFSLAVDPLFPPPPNHTQSNKKSGAGDQIFENKFELVFDEKIDAPKLAEVLRQSGNVILEIDE